MTSSATVRTAAAILAAGLVLAVAPLAPSSAQVSGLGPLRITENSRLGAEAAPVRGRDVPGLAVNPADPNNIVEVDVDYLAGECDFKATFDGGQTWTGGHLRAPAGWPVPPCFQNFDSGGYAHGNASVAWGSGLNVYTTYSSHRGPFQRPESGIIAGIADDSLVARSTDGGRTFEVSRVAIQGGPDAQPFFIRPQLAVQPGGGANGADRIYVSAWACRVTSGGCSAGDDIREMWVSRSDDGGQTWNAPVRASAGPGPTGVNEQIREPGQPVVAADGTVYLTWRNRDGTAVPATQPPHFIVVARSTDQGVTWTRFNAGPVAGGGGHPRTAIDRRNGNLYVAYQNGTFSGAAGDQDIVFVRSTDRGETWSPQIRVNDDVPGNGLSQNNAWVSVALDGRIDVVWHDRRHQNQAGGVASCCLGVGAGTGLGDTYAASSTDGGLTFGPNRRVTDRSLGRDVGLTGVGGYTWYGPVSASLDANRVMIAWTDSREGNFHNGAQDIYFAVMNVRGGGALPVKRLPDAPVSSLGVALSKMAYPGGLEAAGSPQRGVTRVVVVPESDGPAALAGSVLARGNFGPLLASPAARLTPEARAEVSRLEAVGAFVIGNETALSAGVVSDLVAAGVPADQVTRISGGSPAETARLIAESMDNRLNPAIAAGTPAFNAAVIVNPASPEAASAAALGASLRLPILFTDGAAGLPGATRTALTASNIANTLVIGGPGAVADSVLSQLPNAVRIGGASATATFEAVVAEAVARGLPTNRVYVSDPAKPVDAAVLGAAVGRLGGLQLLVPGADALLAEQAIDRLNLRAGVDNVLIAVSGAAGSGYRLVAADGGVFAFGSSFLGSMGATRLNRPVVATATTPSGNGYWLVASDGGVFSFGDAGFFGSTGAIRLAAPIVGMAPTPSGRGYFLVASDGGVFAFGDAVFRGSTGGLRLARPIVSMAPTPSGRGYFLVASDGGVFAFGDAVFRGSTGAIRLAQPIVGAASTPTGNGYWLVASDGGVFAFGDAAFKGSTGALRLARPIVSMARSATGDGYLLAASDGGVFAFGDAVFRGSTGAIRLASPVVGIARG